MMASTPDYVAFVMEQLAPIRGLARTRFFGGVALTANGLQFAMVMGNSLYFAVNDVTRPKYQKMGSDCFWYMTKKGRVDVTRFYEVPGDLLESPPQLLVLALEAIEVAADNKKAVKPARRRASVARKPEA